MQPPENNSNINSFEPEPSPQALQELINAAKQGEIRAFEQLYRYYYPSIYRYLLFALSQPDKTELLANQVFVLVWQRLSDTSSCLVATFSLWLYQLAYQLLVINHLDPRLLPPSKSSDLQLGEDAGADRILVDLPANEISGEFKANQSSESLNSNPNLRQSLVHLKFEAQLILYLCYIEHCSYSQVAQILGLSEEMLKVRHFQALKELRMLVNYDSNQENH